MSESNLYGTHSIDMSLGTPSHTIDLDLNASHTIDLTNVFSINEITTPEISQALAIWYVFGTNVITYSDKYFGKIYFK